MRFVPVKSEETQGAASVFRVRELLIRQRTQTINALRGHLVTYNASLVALLNHYGTIPRAYRPYRAKTKGKIERPFRYIRQDFFLARSFRNLDDLDAQFDAWRTEVANPRLHATSRRIVDEAFADEKPALKRLPAIPYPRRFHAMMGTDST